MKKAEIFLYSFYAIGIVLKLLKLPMHTIFILVSLLFLIIYYTICLIRKNKDLHSILIGFVTVLWLFCLLAILKHFPFQNIVLIIATLASIALVYLLYKKSKLTSGSNIFCSLVIFITIFFKFLPTHYTYYLTNIKFNYEIETDYYSWDKYSWFLYSEGKVDEAIQANLNAQTAVEKSLQNPKYGDENEFLSFIKEHRAAIIDKTWKKYR
jgi:hypothetical protein